MIFNPEDRLHGLLFSKIADLQSLKQGADSQPHPELYDDLHCRDRPLVSAISPKCPCADELGHCAAYDGACQGIYRRQPIRHSLGASIWISHDIDMLKSFVRRYLVGYQVVPMSSTRLAAASALASA